jgi:hypothetical protein
MARKWTFWEIELLKRYYPDCKALVTLLRKNKAVIKRKAASLGLQNKKSSDKKQKPVILWNGGETKTKQPSYKEILSKTETNIETALIALQSAECIEEWTRCLDEYRYWTVRHEQLILNKWLHK